MGSTGRDVPCVPGAPSFETFWFVRNPNPKALNDGLQFSSQSMKIVGNSLMLTVKHSALLVRGPAQELPHCQYRGLNK